MRGERTTKLMRDRFRARHDMTGEMRFAAALEALLRQCHHDVADHFAARTEDRRRDRDGAGRALTDRASIAVAVHALERLEEFALVGDGANGNGRKAGPFDHLVALVFR